MLVSKTSAFPDAPPSTNPLRRLYYWVLKLAEHPRAPYWLVAISFAESSFFLIPPDVLLLPLCLANRKRALHLAALCTVASVLGGLFGYYIGITAFESVGQRVLAFYGALEQFDKAQQLFAANGGLVVFTAGFSPIPYKVITIAAGVFQYQLPSFIFFSLLGRGMRFFLEAFLLQRFGQPALLFIERHFEKLTLAAVALLVGGFLTIKFFL